MNNFLLILTESSKKYLKSVLKDNQALSLGMKPSGCTGYAYVMNVESTEGKHFLTFQGVNFIVEEKNQKYLNNSIVDYKRQGLNSKLTVENPSVKNECGCGESFSLKEVA